MGFAHSPNHPSGGRLVSGQSPHPLVGFDADAATLETMPV